MRIFRRGHSESTDSESTGGGTTATASRCPELGEIGVDSTKDPMPTNGDPSVCEDCMAIGEHHWAHLRMCLTCGHVGCCDSSPRRHATAHFHDSTHPVMRSAEPGEQWRWCYVHEVTG